MTSFVTTRLERLNAVGFAPIEGTGRLGAVRRAEFSAIGPRRTAARRSVPSFYAAALRLVDGRRTVAQIGAAAAEKLALPAILIESDPTQPQSGQSRFNTVLQNLLPTPKFEIGVCNCKSRDRDRDTFWCLNPI